MASHTKILNISRNKLLKRSQAQHFVDAGVSEWLESGDMIRDLTRAERLALFAIRQTHTSTIPDILPPSEGQGLRWMAPNTQKTPRGEISALVVAARQFCMEQLNG
jgi:hypothetical protein